ncbi:hypothetical protein Phi40:1_gp046 [Cellulophaga phage phi40:1]|uniref:Uncharacterized protein n=1 Tax=Cellulophaga phage phi38:1 TaxID=1327977 RepID=R9ZY87_9CAUD|nr:hypothetical protein Phi38:1_gp046 [Cellulophaga phage phi38:1]AGO47911.1 hypothetical protein Phi40:1_gp046 [Cellulophaga phage phi40:1]AGO48076.1 hypothetical protein Phi38:1_gp046 [Cellulophaga phage phi38:1]|tara:strand:- start:474 stop:1178 length:705 start_codon:yes stop_codon:yes gene_type:complete
MGIIRLNTLYTPRVIGSSVPIGSVVDIKKGVKKGIDITDEMLNEVFNEVVEWNKLGSKKIKVSEAEGSLRHEALSIISSHLDLNKVLNLGSVVKSIEKFLRRGTRRDYVEVEIDGSSSRDLFMLKGGSCTDLVYEDLMTFDAETIGSIYEEDILTAAHLNGDSTYEWFLEMFDNGESHFEIGLNLLNTRGLVKDLAKAIIMNHGQKAAIESISFASEDVEHNIIGTEDIFSYIQ